MGNDCAKLLEPSSLLLLEKNIPVEHFSFLIAFKAFGKVVSSCFSSSLSPDYKESIKSFRSAYLKLGLAVTPKVHIVFRHVAEFLDMKGKRAGLGLYSEQHFESSHRQFLMDWSKFKVHMSNPSYKTALTKAVVRFNSLRHIDGDKNGTTQSAK